MHGNHLGALRHADALIQPQGFDFIGLGQGFRILDIPRLPSDSYKQPSLRILSKEQKVLLYLLKGRMLLEGRGQLSSEGMVRGIWRRKGQERLDTRALQAEGRGVKTAGSCSHEES